MPDQRKEAELLQQKYYGKPEELAVELSRICLSKPGVVYQVIMILDPFSTAKIGLRFVNKTSEAVLQKLAVTSDGFILCRFLLYYFQSIRLNNMPAGYNDADLKERLKSKLSIPVSLQTIRRNDSHEPRQLSQTEMDYYDAYNRTDAIMWENVKKVYYSNRGKRNDFDSSICWQLPMSGAGFVVYNQNDLHKDYPMAKRANFKDDYGYDQIGTKETIDAMIYIAKEWANLNTGKQLQYGDISRPGGVNTPDHKTHDDGRAFDVRPIRKDSLVGDAAKLTFRDTSVYDQNLTKNFILLILKLYPGTKFLFNDPKLHRDDPELNSFVTDSSTDHDNHLHVIFPGGK